MRVFIPVETHPGEQRVALIPEHAARLVTRGAEIIIESNAGQQAGHSDAAYEESGARITTDRSAALAESDLVLRVRKPPREEIAQLKRGAIHISFLDPFNEPDLIHAFVEAHTSALSMELIPRSTKAQKMDALSSQASLVGYTAVILAAEGLPQVFPMMMTPAGTIKPATVLVIGAGVAGLQAIATAKRLGARVEAFDTRPAVEEQVLSLGAKFVKIDLGETAQTAQGYAKELTPEQQARQRDAMAAVCARADVIITTAKVFGRPAPIIVTRAMIDRMKPGSVIVDIAVESGGNVEGVALNQETTINGVRIVGLANLESRVAVHASQMYSANLTSLVEAYWDKDGKTFNLDHNDEIIRACLLTHAGTVVNDAVSARFPAAGATA